MNTNEIKKGTVLKTDEPGVSEELFLHQFRKRVVGQPEADRIALSAYQAANNPLRDRTRPIGIYLLIGPSRTGKSLTAEVLAESFHHKRDALTRLHASDYINDGQLLDLKGAPPMYIGYKDPKDPKNQLGEQDLDSTSIISSHNLKKARLGSTSPVDIIVIEEFEKGCADFYKLFMGIFDKGTLRLGNGTEVDFSNTIFILTSNLAMTQLEKPRLGFAAEREQVTRRDVESVVNKAMRLYYPPEFRNRLDAVVIYAPHSHGNLLDIVGVEVDKIAEQAKHMFALRVETSAREYLLAEATRNGGGVADLKRVTNRLLLAPLGRELNKGTIGKGDLITVSYEVGSSALSFARLAQVSDSQKEAMPLTAAAGLAANAVSTSQAVNLEREKHAFDRELQIAELVNAEADHLKEYCLTVTAAMVEEVYVRAIDLEYDLKQVFRLTIEQSTLDRQAPSFSFIVKSARPMLDLIRKKHPAVTISKVPAITENA